MIGFRQIILFVSIVLFGIPLFSQVTKIRGKVVDAETQEVIPFANVYFLGTTIGVTSDFEGDFSFETFNPSDTLVASFVGYDNEYYKVIPGKYQEVNFLLKQSSFDLPPFLILSSHDPMKILFNNIQKNKSKNKRNDFKTCKYEIYNKLRIDANNITDKFQERRIFKPFDFIFDYMDTSVVNGKVYLPLFLSESLSDYYIKNNPHMEKEVIKAGKITGVTNESVLQFVGDMFQSYSIYENYIQILEKNFISPIANVGYNYYQYYLVDTALRKNRHCIKVMFKPKRKQELTFSGYFWVHDTTFAIESFEMRIPDDANINYVNDLLLGQEFDLIDGKYWMVVKDKGIADFNILKRNKKLMGFYGSKTTFYDKFILDAIQDEDIYRVPTNVIVEKDAFNTDEGFWEKNRYEELSKDEKTIDFMIDTLSNLPAFKTWIDLVETIVTGYYRTKNFEFGPYMSAVSFNMVEGLRFKAGGRTSRAFSKRFRFHGHVAMGTSDPMLKYGFGGLYIFNKNPRSAFGFDYLKDVEQLGMSSTALASDILLTAVLRRQPAAKLSLTKEATATYHHEWFNGFSSEIKLINKIIIPYRANVIVFNEEDKPIDHPSIVTSELRINTHFAFHEKFVMGQFGRISLGTNHPVLNVDYILGFSNFLQSQFNYQKLIISLRHKFNFAGIGRSEYFIEAGKLWGKAPMPLLFLHPGNETFLYNRYAFNLMNYFEFVSDQYICLFYTHHLGGLILNKIPLMRKLKWRETIHFKGVMGSLSNRNRDYNIFPDITRTLNKPYFEGGVGIENIFTIFKIDAVWRFTHKQNPKISNFALLFGLQFSF